MAIFLLLLNAEPLQYVIIEVQDIFLGNSTFFYSNTFTIY